MKANELMIGDWVYAIDDNGEKHPCRANNLEYDYTNKRGDFCVDFYGTGYDAEWPDVAFNVEPIPLTPKILEKNGFKDVSNHTLKGCETYELSFGRDNDQKIIYKLGDYFAYESYDDRWYRLFETQICHKWCVHHLQHALRLCGIEKEIMI